MKKLLSLIVLISVLFSFWSCTNQEDEIFEESKDNINLLKRQNVNPLGPGKFDRLGVFSYITIEYAPNLTIFPDDLDGNLSITEIRNYYKETHPGANISLYSSNQNENPYQVVDVWQIFMTWDIYYTLPNDKDILETDLDDDPLLDWY